MTINTVRGMTISTIDTTDRPAAAALIRRASNEVNVFGTVCCDTAALLLAEGIDVAALEGFTTEDDI